MLRRTLQLPRAIIAHIKGKEDYQKQAQNSKGYILYFGASWCGPCKAMAPILQSKEKEGQGKWNLLKVDIDEEKNQILNEEFGVQAVPTMVFFKDGKQVDRTVGGFSQQGLKEHIKKIL